MAHFVKNGLKIKPTGLDTPISTAPFQMSAEFYIGGFYRKPGRYANMSVESPVSDIRNDGGGGAREVTNKISRQYL